MKRRSLFNRIISLSIVAVLFLTSSASAFADVDEGSAPAVEETVESSEEAAISDVPATEEAVVPSEENSSIGEVVGKIVDKVAEVIGGDSQTPKEGSEATDEANKDEAVGENPEGNPEGIQEGEPEGDPKENPLKDDEKDKTEDGEADEEKLDEEAKEECEHELVYTSNGDGTHTVKCSKCDMEEYTESCEFDENGVCIHCGYKRLPDPILVYEDDEVIVTVKGAVPENADLKVTPIKKDIEETKEAYDAVEQKLLNETDIEEHDVYGFLAYDISFIDIETKEEVEPSGDVTVKLEYKSAVLPVEDVDLEQVESVDVSVIHINEETEQVEDLSEADKANFELNDNKAITKAEFTNDLFSTYIFKYTISYSNERNIKIIFNNLDRNLDNITKLSITEKEHRVDSTTGKESIASFKDDIEGYRFVKAQYTYKKGTQNLTSDVTDFEYYKRYGSSFVYLHILNGDDEIDSIKMDNGGDATVVTIDMIYEKDLSLSITKKATGPAALDTETEYVFQLLRDGEPVTHRNYKNGTTTISTDDDGLLKLKSGESADFMTLPDGRYKVIEKEVVSDEYTMTNFKTAIIINGEQQKVYETDAAGDRSTDEFTVENGKSNEILFKNYYHTRVKVYEKEEQRSKYILYNPEDEDYQLQVKFRGPTEVYEETTFEKEVTTDEATRELNIVLVIDKSGSMNSNGNGRIYYVQNAVKTIAEIFKTKRHVDAKWKVINFSDDASVISSTRNWVDNDTLYGIANSSNFTFTSGGTNYQKALRVTNEVLGTSNSGAEKVVIFLTDGEPNLFIGGGNGYAAFVAEAYKRAKTEAAKITCDAFYSIGVDFGGTTHTVDGEGVLSITNILENITNQVQTKNKSTSTVETGKIIERFSDIAGIISSGLNNVEDSTEEIAYLASNVIVSDPLSEYAQIKKGTSYYIAIKDESISIDDDHPSNELADLGRGEWRNGGIDAEGNATTAEYDIYKIDDGNVIYDENGKPVVEATVYAKYEEVEDEDNPGVIIRRMKMTFSDGYKLPANYSFTVAFIVEPTDAAYDEYLANGYGDVVGDPNTDHVKAIDEGHPTSAGFPGFRTNADANVKYDFNGTPETKTFPRPVLQVHVSYEWEVYKVDDSVGGVNKLPVAVFKLNQKGADNQETEKYKGTSSSDSDKKGLVIWEGTEKIPAGIYVLRESEAPLGYVRSSEYWEISIDEENKPTVTVCKPDNGNSKESYEQAYSELIAAQEQFDTPQYFTERDGNVITYKFYFKNSSAYQLPETGGNGIYRTTLYGIVLMLTSVFLFYRNKKKQKVCIK